MSKQMKQMEMDALKDTFQDVRDFVVLSVTKIDATLDNTLRHNLRKKNIRLKMVKNSLTRRIFGEMGIQLGEDSPYWKGNSLMAWGADSLAGLSKAIEAEMKGKLAPQLRDKLLVKGAISDGQPVSFEQALKMPTREEAIARVIGLALSPASRLVSQLLAPASRVAGQVKSLAEKGPGEEGAPAEAPAEPAAS